MTPREWGLLLALAVLWSASFFFGKVALAQLGPLTLVLGRVAIAALALNLALVAQGHRLPSDRRQWGAFAIMGLLGSSVPFVLIAWAQTHIASGLASILNATTPLFAVVFAHFMTTDERLNGRRLLGVVLGVGGVALMTGTEALAGSGIGVVGEIAVLAAACCYALSNIYGRRFRALPPLIPATAQITVTAIVILPLALMVEQPWHLPPLQLRTVVAVMALALLSTALAYAISFRLLATAGATNLSTVTFLIPVGALFLGVVILGERLEPHHLGGMALIFAGLATLDGRLFRVLKVARGRRLT